MKWRKNTESKNPKDVKTKTGRIMLLVKCAMCNSRKPKLIKECEAGRLLNSLEIRTPLCQIPLLDPFLL